MTPKEFAHYVGQPARIHGITKDQLGVYAEQFQNEDPEVWRRACGSALRAPRKPSFNDWENFVASARDQVEREKKKIVIDTYGTGESVETFKCDLCRDTAFRLCVVEYRGREWTATTPCTCQKAQATTQRSRLEPQHGVRPRFIRWAGWGDNACHCGRVHTPSEAVACREAGRKTPEREVASVA